MDTETTQPKTIPETAITRTSINIRTDFWDEMRVIAIRRKKTAGEAVEAAIRLWVDTWLPGDPEPAPEPKRKRA